MIDFDDPIDAKWAQRVLDLEAELDKTREIASEQFSYFEAELSEAQAQKCEEIHPGFAEFRALQKDHRETVAQLSEARAEADRRVVALVDERRAYKAHIAEVESERDEARAEVAHYSAEAERLDARWTQEHVALVKAEAALEQLRARSCSCICHEDGEAAFERGKEEGKREQREAELGMSLDNRPGEKL